MKNILESLKELSIENEVNDFVGKIKDLIALEQQIQKTLRDEENTSNNVAQFSMDIFQCCADVKKQFENSYYQLSIAASTFEDLSYQYFELSRYSSSSDSTTRANVDLERQMITVKHKMKNLEIEAKHLKQRYLQERKVSDILHQDDNLVAVLEEIGQKMELMNQRVQTMEIQLSKPMNSATLINHHENKSIPNESRVVSRSYQSVAQRKLWKQFSQQVKAKSRPCLSLSLFEEVFENSNVANPTTPIPAARDLQSARRTEQAKIVFLDKMSHHSPMLQRNKVENFQIINPELGEWTYLSSPFTSPPEKTPAVDMSKSRKSEGFDDTNSPLLTVLDRVNQLQYTKVMKETTTITPASSATPVSKGGHAQSTGPPETTGLTSSSKKEKRGFNIPEVEENKVTNVLTANDKISRKLALDVTDKRSEGKSLLPEATHSPLAFPKGEIESKLEFPATKSGSQPLLEQSTLLPPPVTSTSTLDQIKALYTQYNPEKLSELPKLLQKYEGKYEELYQKLVQKYVTKGSSSGTGGVNATPGTGGLLSGATTSGAATSTTKTTAASSATAPSGFLSTPASTIGTTPSSNPSPFGKPLGSSLFGNNNKTTTSTTTPGATPFPATPNTGATSLFTPGAITAVTTSNNNSNPYYAVVQEIYQKYNPTKLEEIPNLLLKYTGKEMELIMKLKKKYNVNEPIQAEAGLSSSGGGGLMGANPTIMTGFNNNTQTPSSVFGTAGKGNSPMTPFANNNNAPNTSSLFGNKPAAATTPFANNNNMNSNNNTMSTPMTSGFQTSGFASGNVTTPSLSTSLFGGGNNNNNNVTATAAMGNGVPTSTLFGQGGGFGGNSPSVFGNNNNNAVQSSSGFGTTVSPFGGNSGPSLFGNANPTNTIGMMGSNAPMVNPQLVRNRVLEIYQQFNPTKITEIPKLLEKYQGREQELISKLEQKYGASSTMTPATSSPGFGMTSFGASQPSLFGNGNNTNNMPSTPFAQGGGLGGQTTPSLFGNSNAAASSPFTGNTGNSLFANVVTPGFSNATPVTGTGFGQTSAFGQPSSFGMNTNTANSGFGMTSGSTLFGNSGGFNGGFRS